MVDLVQRVTRFARRYRLWQPGETLVVGVSGGPDSLCLLHVLHRITPEQQLAVHVAHLNHGLRGVASEADAEAVAELAAAWGMPCTTGRADVVQQAQQAGLSLEEAAREARYAFLAQTAEQVGARTVVVGHHADDQAETVLMHFLRGSGPAGLRGMLPRTALAGTSLQLIRPLLEISRADVLAYCAEHELQPRYDRSNEDLVFARNRLRHELLPLLATYNPAIRETLARTAAVMAGDYELLEAQVESAWAQVVVQGNSANSGDVRFDRAAWQALPLALQRATTRRAIQLLRSTLRNVSWEHVERAVWLGREGVTGQEATLAAGLALRIGYRELRIGPEGAPWTEDAPQVALPLALAAPGETLLDGWRLRATLLNRETLPTDYAENPDPWTAYLDAEVTGPSLVLRPPRPGERFQPLGLGGHSTSIKAHLINAKIPRDLRPRWPVLEGKDGVAWVCGLRLDERAGISARTRRVWVVAVMRV